MCASPAKVTTVLQKDQVLKALEDSVPNALREYLHAFYSSELGGIVTDPAFMLVPIDDHLVHRGHAVFDTASLINGYLYQLEPHLDRILSSAAKARIPAPMSKGALRQTILDTVVASGRKSGEVRYWIGAGRGGFALSSKECVRSSLYIVVYSTSGKALDASRGWAVTTSPVPPKDDMFATIKSNNYLPNALNAMDAEAQGYDEGVFVDAAGYVCEGPAMNIAFILTDGTLVVPPFDKTLAGVTIQRVMKQLPKWKERNHVLREGLGEVEMRPITVDEAKGCKEAFMAGSTTRVMPVVRWDDVLINGGVPGPLALALRSELDSDMQPSAEHPAFTPVPY